MSNLGQRALLFVIFLPILGALLFLLPQRNHLAFNIFTLLFAVGLAFESSRIVGLFPTPSDHSKRKKTLRVVSVPIMGSLPVILVILISQQMLPFSTLYTLSILALILVFATQVIRTQWAPFKETLPQVLAYTFILLYPGLLFAHLTAITLLPNSSDLLLIFLGSVFANDTLAYVFGRLFGRFSFQPFKVSPHKTFIGFLAGFLASVGVVVLAQVIKPELFPSGLGTAIFLGALMGFGTIVGDLFESALKRSANLKDSGTIMPGRGGLLDSLDSTIFSAPIFFFAYVYTQAIPLGW